MTSNFRADLNFTFITGVRGKDAQPLLATTVAEVPDNYERSPRDSPEYLGALGCTISHLLAISTAERQGVDFALILEDDVVPDLLPFWPSNLFDFVADLPKDWSIVQLSLIGEEAMWNRAYEQWESRTSKSRVAATTEFWSTAAYLVSKPAMRAILSRFRPGPQDRFNLSSVWTINLDILVLKESVPAGTYFISTPPLFTFADSEQSDIHAMPHKNSFAHFETEGRAHLHQLSRTLSLEWSSIAWRCMRMLSGTNDRTLLISHTMSCAALGH